ncbi:phospholipid scramblase [Plakobranchus ocellatus]|uniref:Phospholipid scramblase n=1 Tax=Plakobranchus ocellatus TaxID=259542 RepID=A0AAV4CSZ7_9GAST|nr:phospholipid scramblase [Plakobranchus ocellatus]
MGIFDANDTLVYEITGPCCPCQTPCCKDDIDYPITSVQSRSQIGMIKKVWSGVMRECFTDTEMFSLQFPLDLDVKHKALMLAAVFLVGEAFPKALRFIAVPGRKKPSPKLYDLLLFWISQFLNHQRKIAMTAERKCRDGELKRGRQSKIKPTGLDLDKCNLCLNIHCACLAEEPGVTNFKLIFSSACDCEKKFKAKG